METSRWRHLTSGEIFEVRAFEDLGRPGLNQMEAHELLCWLLGREVSEDGEPGVEYSSSRIAVDRDGVQCEATLGELLIRAEDGNAGAIDPFSLLEDYDMVEGPEEGRTP